MRRERRVNRVRAYVEDHLADGGLVVVPANVVAETRRGRRSVNVDWVLDAYQVAVVDRSCAAVAGQMLETEGRGSSDLADATVAATAALARASLVIVLTSEKTSRSGAPNDIETFVQPWASKVIVRDINTI